MQYFDESLRDQSFALMGQRLRAEIDAADRRLGMITDQRAGVPRAPGKWSRKEIVGHLIDSAANNHQRFVRAQSDPVRLPGYAQEHWVTSQRYSKRAWRDLIDLWSSYNRHLAHVVAHIPESRRSTPCEIGEGPPVPLSHIALDYIGHLQHHLKQVFE